MASFAKLFGRFSPDLGIDLGTANTLVYVRGRGIVVNEPSIVAINSRTAQIVAVGQEARKMLGKTPTHITATRPLIDGVISDFEVAEKMLRYFIDKVQHERFAVRARPRVLMSLPLDVTEVEKKAVEDAARSAGAREVLLVEQPVAAALGARLQILDAAANMVVDIGGGTTQIAVISLGGVVTWKSMRLAGDELNRNIIQYAREQFNLLIGERTAEEIKMQLGSADELEEPLEMLLRGRDLVSGLPREITISDNEVRSAISRTVRLIVENVKSTLEVTPPELVSDIYRRGMILTGGGALLRGLDRVIAQSAQVPVQVADDPLTAVVRGTGIVLEDLEVFREVLVPTTAEEFVR